MSLHRNREWCRCIYSLGAMVLLVELSSQLNNSECSTISCEKLDSTPGSNPFRILVVGSGLTGSLTAMRIRQRQESMQNHKKMNIDLNIVERATYPAGRFGAIANCNKCVADIGAQVLSTVNPYDPRAMGGHGIGLSDIKLSNIIVQDLLSTGLLRPAPDESLACTDERMIWEDLWQHYFPTKSMSNLLEFILQRAKTKPIFGVRIDSIKADDFDSGIIRVKGISRVVCPIMKNLKEEPFIGTYHSVVFCIPAPDACVISGILNMLDDDSRMVLKNVAYDKRTCEAHFFSSKLLPFLKKAFASTIEINIDEEIDEKEKSGIEYISFQNGKRHHIDLTTDNNETCSIVLHSRAGHVFPNEYSKLHLDKELSKLTGLTESEISSCRLGSKNISWETSQMIRPMESIISNPQVGWQCLTNPSGSLILAGDYMTQSSFLGCVATADAASKTVIDTISRYYTNR